MDISDDDNENDNEYDSANERENNGHERTRKLNENGSENKAYQSKQTR